MKHWILFATLLSFAANSHAAVIFDNGAPDNVNGYNITQYRTADNFTLVAGATVGSIRFFWVADSPAEFGGAITYAIYSDNSGALGSLVSTATVSGLGSTPTGGFLGTLAFQRTDINLSSAVLLPPGSYWLELHEGASLITTESSTVHWATSAQTGDAKLDFVPNLPANSIDKELAFQLNDLSGDVPEPGALILVGAG